MASESAVRELAMNLDRIDTHSHFDGRLGDARSTAKNFDDHMNTGQTTAARIWAEGVRQLYGIDTGIFFSSAAPEEVYTKAEALRADGPAKALERAMDAGRISQQFVFTLHNPGASPLATISPRVKLLAYIDWAVAGDGVIYCPEHYTEDFIYFDAIQGRFGPLATLDDYLDAIDEAIDGWRSHGVVGMKTAFAYTLGLKFSDPTRQEAQAAFARKRDMSPQDAATVQHYAFRHALLGCKRNGLPVVIHTGFQIWGQSSLEQSNPMLLHNLLIDPRYKDLTFVLLHGGNPYVGETTYLARMFPNVIIDFTWIAWMTRARFRMALAEWIEIVPHTRFCWGSDSNVPENIVGIGQIVREVIANVLEDLMDRRIIDEKTALNFIQKTYLDTPKRVFSV